MDYKTEIDNTKVDFNKIYEDALQATCDKLTIDCVTANFLKAKRSYGLQKYGKYSFQSNFNNAMASPVIEHMFEECIDLMNYLLHKIFVQNIKGGIFVIDYSNVLKRIYDIFIMIKGLKEKEEKLNSGG